MVELFTGQSRPISFDTDFSQFSYSYTCLIVFAILWILTARRDMGIFIKINTFGVIFTIIIILSICSIGVYAIATNKYEYHAFINNDKGNPLPVDPSAGVVLMFATQYSHLMGILGGGFYLHNISLPIYRNSKNPENNVRDMFIGFLVVAISYILCGVLGYYGFQSINIFGPGVPIN